MSSLQGSDLSVENESSSFILFAPWERPIMTNICKIRYMSLRWSEDPLWGGPFSTDISLLRSEAQPVRQPLKGEHLCLMLSGNEIICRTSGARLGMGCELLLTGHCYAATCFPPKMGDYVSS